MNKGYKLISRLFSEGAGLNGEWWIDESGYPTFTDGDIGENNHATAAIQAALGFSYEDQGVPQIIAHEPLSEEAIAWLRTQGSDEEAIEFLKDGSDPRDYVLTKLGWIRVKDSNFQTMHFSNDALNNIRSFIGEMLEDDVGYITIEEMSTGDMFNVPVKMIMNTEATVPGIKRYCSGYGVKDEIVDSSELKGKRWDPWDGKFREERILNILSSSADGIYPSVIGGLFCEGEEPKKVRMVPIRLAPQGYKMFSEVREAVLIRRNNFDLIARNERKLSDASDNYSLVCCSSDGIKYMVISESVFNDLWKYVIPNSIVRCVRYRKGDHFINKLDNAVAYLIEV